MGKDLLPDSRLKHAGTPKGWRSGGPGWIPAYCANCGRKEGWVVDNGMHAFVLCNACAETHGQIAGTMAVPEEVYYAKVHEAQMETYGRILTAYEQAVELSHPDSMLSRLKRDHDAIVPIN